jgi:heme A synthase
VALLLLISSFFAKIPGGVKWALIVFLTMIVQVALGLFAHAVPLLGVLHGIVALVLFGVAVSAAMRVSTATRAAAANDVTSTPARV